MKTILTFVLVLSVLGFAQQTPLEKNGHTKITSYPELVSFIKELDSSSSLMKTEVIARSVEGRDIYAALLSKNGFGKDRSKIRVLIFCQQHGNEQGGKEGGLLLIRELLKPASRYLFNKMDIAIVPQMNPDGAEKNTRRNGDTMDLNRNHLILTEPETIGLHKLFDKYLFEVTMDVHEYYPFGDSWKDFGYRLNNDLEIGLTSNINVSQNILQLSRNDYLPFIEKYLATHHVTAFEYSPGGPPEGDYIRHSTFDINDGRQSLGIQNTFSFIQEGLNGTDALNENLKHRAESQMYGMRGLIDYAYANKDKIKSLVAKERKELIKGKAGEKVAIQLGHFPDGSKLQLPLYSYKTGKDTVITVNNFHPLVKSLTDVVRPKGYLIPKSCSELIAWADRQGIKYKEYKKNAADTYEQYFIARIDSMDFEGDTIVNPDVQLRKLQNELPAGDYIFIPTAQLKNNLIIIGLEPKSELGLVTYKKYEHLLKKGENYPVLRIP
jgi:hypothetical protein